MMARLWITLVSKSKGALYMNRKVGPKSMRLFKVGLYGGVNTNKHFEHVAASMSVP